MDVNLINLHVDGHHRSYLEMLASFWSESVDEGVLRIFVTERFRDTHADFFAERGERVEIQALDVGKTPSGGTSMKNMARLDRMHAQALRQVSETQTGPIVLMHFDDAQTAMARFRGRRDSVSGLYFRSPLQERETGRLSRSRMLRKDVVLRLALRNQGLHRVFCLDPRDVAGVDRVAGRSVALALPDGVERATPLLSPDDQRLELGATEQSRVLLMFGDISRRKGIGELTVAIAEMESKSLDRMTLVVAGLQRENEREFLAESFAAISECVHFVEIDRRLSDSEMASLFAASDVVLVPYTAQHVGSSGILLRAAAWGRPVVGPDVGLMAQYIRSHRLGQTVNLRAHGELARALQAVVENPLTDFDEESALAFGRTNSSHRFAAAIFTELGCAIL